MNKIKNFIEKSKERYGDAYNYSLVNYNNSSTLVRIICNVHKNIFEQLPVDHLRGRNGCKLCSTKVIKDTNSFIKKAKEKHADKYEYSESIYVNSSSKIKILCQIHGIFSQLPISHVNGHGCPKCKGLSISNKKTMSTNSFIEKAINKHEGKYDYSLVEYINSKTKIKIICPKHGEFEQQAVAHLRGKGCSKCATDRAKKSLTKTKEEFIIDAIAIHGDKYNYSLVNYINSHIKVKIICPQHGEFEQVPYDHITNHGCVNCSSSVSSQEFEINEFLTNLGLETIQSSTSIIVPYQLDIYIPSHKIAIEFNGLYWHNELRVDKNYHLNKTELCESKGIKLIHIFEDEWINKKDIVKSRLKNILGLTTKKIYGRNCVISKISVSETKGFLDTNHLQGNTNSTIRLGLYHNNELVSLMLFNKPRLGIGSYYDGYELTRFCNILNTSVIGAANKLLKYFIKTYNPKQIKSYADRRWSQGDLYEKLGFINIHVNEPNYHYIIGKIRKHRFNFRKAILKKEGFNITNKTEHEIMLERKIYRIYDCGTICYQLIVD